MTAITIPDPDHWSQIWLWETYDLLTGTTWRFSERDRWTVRGEYRTRETYGYPHPGDFPGRAA